MKAGNWITGGKAWFATAAIIVLQAFPAAAQAPGNAFSSYSKENSNKPIDIESDKLEVDDKGHIATFSGNVSATQGEYNLRSQKLEVYYERVQQDAQANAPPPQKPQAPSQPPKPIKASAAASAGDPMSNGQIKIIKAFGGRVVVTSAKDNQTATGNDALYDVKAQKITMNGDVVLVQKGNVVNGDKLNIDLATGRAVVIPKGSGNPNDPNAVNGGKTRVRAILKRDGGNTTNPMEALTGIKKKKPAADDQQTTPPEQPKASAPNWQTKSQ